MDHLVSYTERELNKLRKKRRAKIIWVRKRREAPVGEVAKGDNIYFKNPGGGVFGTARVLSVKDLLKAGRYSVVINIAKPRVFRSAYAVIKRDRRSWVVCRGKPSDNQQVLIPLPSPTVIDCVAAVKKHYRTMPNSKQILETIKHIAETGKDVGGLAGLLFLLAIMAAEKNDMDLHNELRGLLTKHPTKVTPLAIFRGK